MTDISDHQREQIYKGDRNKFDLDVDIDADVIDRDYSDTALNAVERVRQAVRREAQAIQDELDTEDTDGDG